MGKGTVRRPKAEEGWVERKHNPNRGIRRDSDVAHTRRLTNALHENRRTEPVA